MKRLTCSQLCDTLHRIDLINNATSLHLAKKHSCAQVTKTKKASLLNQKIIKENPNNLKKLQTCFIVCEYL